MKIAGVVQKHWLLWIALSLCPLLMASCTASPATPPPSNGAELPTYQLQIELPGAKHEASIDSKGRLKTSVQVASANGKISLSLKEGTVVLDKDENPLQLIQAAVDPTLALPPEGAYIVGAVYDLRPHGATFNPSLKLTLNYHLIAKQATAAQLPLL